ncbi:MAG TPA: BON domain-containing protein, partial [Candidatus Limnocylindrales bacterium]|nr:BON domain-containing protein [Candidatus Limnocylindrales bacterium]
GLSNLAGHTVRCRTESAARAAHNCGNDFPQLNRAMDPIESLMSLLKRCSALFIAALLLSMLGCAATSTQESTGEYIDDSVITAKVKSAILNEPSLKVFQINVETYKNVVQLSGAVATRSEVAKAGELARSVKGVRSVKNDLRLK